jgi:hypothetical protein
MISKLICSIVLGAGFMLASQGIAGAQSRTWVSGVGDDVNPCSRTAPCKTFPGAISKTAAGGEITVLDSGSFGTLTITKAISIVAEGLEAGVSACNTNGITVNAGVNDVVTIHGLIIEGCGTGVYGIRVVKAKAVHIRNCQIRGFTPAASTAIRVEGANKVFVEDCDIGKNDRGIVALGTSEVFLNRSTLKNHAAYGLRANDAGTSIILSRSHVTHNLVGLSAGGTGQMISYGNNIVAENGSGEVFDQTKPLK